MSQNSFEENVIKMFNNENEINQTIRLYKQNSHNERSEEKKQLNNNISISIDEANNPPKDFTLLFRFIDVSSTNSLFNIMENELKIILV